MYGEPKSESWFHSPEFDAGYRRRRAQQRSWFRRNKIREEIADPEEVSSEARRRAEARARYFSRETDLRRRGDLRQALPRSYGDLRALADSFGAAPHRLEQGLALERRGLNVKGKRVVLCGRIGKRQNCTSDPRHRFSRVYRCSTRYCSECGPRWFRRKFSDLLSALEPIVEHLLHEGQHRGRKMVVAKLDITVPNTGQMPTPKFVRRFHADVHRFWRAVERRFGISQKEYGQGGNDEFGGGNTNLHRHCVYVGPWLPQRKKELSRLWSEIRGDRSFVSIKRARSLRAALAHALKYPAKFLTASTPERLAELEATFHGTRRFSTGGAFYRLKMKREPGEDLPVGTCPVCGAPMEEVLESWVPLFLLEAEGRQDVEQVRRDVGRAKIFSGEQMGTGP